MNINQDNINSFLNKYISFVDKVSFKYNYPSNIKHLLYLIVPAFIIKYGISNEMTILKCFEFIKIYIKPSDDKFVVASFNRVLKRNSSNYFTDKYIVLNEFDKASLPNLIDSIVHEFNHAVNSINNEVSYDEKTIKVRTGLSYLIYDRKTLKFISKSKEVALEETINTEQTEEIINIINSFNNYKIDNIEFSNMLFALKNEIKDSTYTSNAYSFQSYICDILMKNKTFTPTISNLRFKGLVEDVSALFDNVIGRRGSYKKLNELLEEIYSLQIKYSKSLLFKKLILNKLKKKANMVLSLIQEYDSKCIYK